MALAGKGLLFLVFLVVSDDFLNDEIQESLGEIGVQIGLFRQVFQPGDLRFFARGIGRGEVVFRLELAHRLGVLEPLAQGIDEDRIQTVDAFAMLFQKLGGACGGISQWQSLSV